MTIAIAQVAPVFLCRDATIGKVVQWIDEAAATGAALVAFGEAVLGGYPIWLERTGGARFNNADQKRIHGRYVDQAIDPSPQAGHLQPILDAAARGSIAVSIGIIERAADRGGHSLYCTRAFISSQGELLSLHRKLMPTYEERLCWGTGDGHGLVTHPVGPFHVGALLCWENWMPLARAALYGQGENLHLMHWPGGEHNTRDLTPVVAKEARSYVVSACGLLRGQDIPDDVPLKEQMAPNPEGPGDPGGPGEVILNGGSCICAPDGSWLVEPIVGCEHLITAELDLMRVYEERQNFDPSGHYARPDVLQLHMNRQRQAPVQ